jgi:subtilisin family serine protease
MKNRYIVMVALALALALISSTGGSAWAASPELVRVIIGWAPSEGVQSQEGFFSKSGFTSPAQTTAHLGGNIRQNYHLISASSAEIPATQIEKLRNSPGVAYVVLDSEVHILGDTIPWGITAIKADQVQPTNSGVGVKVAVIDTGIDLTHSDLKVAGNVSFIGTATGNDDNGHGTHVAGTIAALKNSVGVVGVAPGVQLFALKALDSAGFGYLSNVVAAIQWAIDNHMNVINMSLGCNTDAPILHQICDQAYKAGIVVVAAAGNDGYYLNYLTNTVQYPAAYDSVIAVGATDVYNSRAAFSSFGPGLELMAPGLGIRSTYKGNRYADASGTSMAAPHVSGAAALLFANGVADHNHNGFVNDEIRSILDKSATDLGDPGRDNRFGFGLVNVLQAIQTADLNNAPLANAGPDQSSVINTLINLNGSGSKDADGDILSYTWTQLSGSLVSLNNPKSTKATFTPTSAGTYSFQLTVSDGKASGSDSVVITITLPAVKGLRVKNVNLKTTQNNSRLTIAATVQVTDLQGVVQLGVTVQGHWSGSVSGNVSGRTGSNGLVSFSKSITNPANGSTYNFVVDGLAKTGYTYNLVNSQQTSNSLTWGK